MPNPFASKRGKGIFHGVPGFSRRLQRNRQTNRNDTHKQAKKVEINRTNNHLTTVIRINIIKVIFQEGGGEL